MRVAFVQTYPIYHDLWSTRDWLALHNRDRWMPGILADMGHEVEMLAVGDEEGTFQSSIDGFGDYPIRIFRPRRRGRRTKFDYSPALLSYAAQAPFDFFVLKGIDGGVGVHLVREILHPNRRPFAFIIGGKFYNHDVPQADVVLYEQEGQRRLLESPGWRVWRTPVKPERLIRLPKSIDTDAFTPVAGAEKRWDVLSVGRLVKRNKNYDALGTLSRRLRVAVVGGGPSAASLQQRFPRVDWLGQRRNAEIPAILSQAHVFFHSGLRDFFPRVLAEAGACGLPCVAFASAISADVLPESVGLRVHPETYVKEIVALVEDADRRARMATMSRQRAVNLHGKFSSKSVLEHMMRVLSQREKAAEPA